MEHTATFKLIRVQDVTALAQPVLGERATNAYHAHYPIILFHLKPSVYLKVLVRLIHILMMHLRRVLLAIIHAFHAQGLFQPTVQVVEIT